LPQGFATAMTTALKTIRGDQRGSNPYKDLHRI